MNEQKTKKPLRKFWKITIPMVSIGMNWIIFLIGVFNVINNLPRLSPGEQVIIPLALCLGGLWGGQLIVPSVLSFVIFRDSNTTLLN